MTEIDHHWYFHASRRERRGRRKLIWIAEPPARREGNPDQMPVQLTLKVCPSEAESFMNQSAQRKGKRVYRKWQGLFDIAPWRPGSVRVDKGAINYENGRKG